ncbi:MAG: hypothetical protein AABW73_02650 [Nanoarchaeota archaeon]
MNDLLLREELPLQSVKERGEDLTATVPVNPRVMRLDPALRVNLSTINDPCGVVKDWYNIDMDYHLGVLRADGVDPSSLRGYERFRDDWVISATPQVDGFLSLGLSEGDRTLRMCLAPVPIFLSNEKTELGSFCNPDYSRSRGWVEVVYRRIEDPEVVLMSPEKMRSYSLSDLVRGFDGGREEVTANCRAFCSDYDDIFPRVLALRNMGVFYLNNLLGLADAPANN